MLQKAKETIEQTFKKRKWYFSTIYEQVKTQIFRMLRKYFSITDKINQRELNRWRKK